MRERDIPPSQDRRFDIENPAPAHLGKANGIPLFPHLKTLQLLTRTTSVVSSASTLVSRPSTSNSKENPEIHIERAYTLQPPIADHNSNYLSDKELGKKRGRDSVSTEAYETIMYSQRSPQWDNSVAKRFSTASTIRFARFSRGWGLRSSAMSSDRVTVFDEGNHQTSPSPTSAQSPRSAKSPSMLRRTSQMAFGRGRGSVAYKKLSPSESPQADAIKFPPTEEVPEETAYQTTPLAPPPVRMKPRSQTPNNHGGSTSERGIAADESTSTSQWDRGHTRPDPAHANTGSQPPSMPSLYNLDSAFQLQEYISLLVRRDPEDIDAIVKIPNAASNLLQDDPNLSPQDIQEVDQNCWIYEHLRRLAQDLTYPLITLLQVECTRQSCPEMKAGEWLYLCVAHGNGGTMEQCCAIDYILHTLDSATALLNSSRNFPSRIAIPTTSTRHFPSLARRLSRIFAHAYFHHRELFEHAEAESALYERFLGLVQEFQLVPAEYLVIPWEGRPPRKPKHAQYAAEKAREEDLYAVEPARPRTIMTRDSQEDRSLSANNANDTNLTASPSGGSLSRRRTETMYMTGEVAAALLDPILSSGGEIEVAHKESIPDAPSEVAAIPSSEEQAEEMVEPVDPFEDDNVITEATQEEDLPSSFEESIVLGDDVHVPDVAEVIPTEEEETKEADSWPDIEVLEKEAVEASDEGQVREDVVLEPVPTPADEAPTTDKVEETEVTEEVEEAKEAKEAKEVEEMKGEEEAPAESLAEALEKPEHAEMLMNLEEERKQRFGVTDTDADTPAE
ncbi:hypothetical protein FRC14_007057 [Serendipita sp. 396]|nr:hypothetical protein FRC14_007057 [Serendipita sp. 396]